MVFLPEACDYICDNTTESVKLAESLDGPLVSKYRIIAQENCIWISVGVHLKVSIAHTYIDSCFEFDGKIIK